MLAVLDVNRYPFEIRGAPMLKDAEVALVEISPEGNDEERFYELRGIERSRRAFSDYLLLTLTAKHGIQLPHPIERRLFFWQTYLEGIPFPGSRP